MKSACLHIEEAVNGTCMLAVDCFVVTKWDAVVFVGVVVVLLGVVVGAGVVDALDSSVVVVLVLNVDEGIEVDLGKSGSPSQLRVRRTLRLSTVIKEHDTCKLV